MHGSRLTVPPPKDNDHDDVAWALRAAAAQWRRAAQEDAIGWVRRASETAQDVGDARRALELNELAHLLSGSVLHAQDPPPLTSEMKVGDHVLEVDAQAIEVEFDDDDDDLELLEDVDEFEEIDALDDDVEDLGDDDEIELIEDDDDIVELDVEDHVPRSTPEENTEQVALSFAPNRARPSVAPAPMSHRQSSSSPPSSTVPSPSSVPRPNARRSLRQTSDGLGMAPVRSSPPAPALPSLKSKGISQAPAKSRRGVSESELATKRPSSFKSWEPIRPSTRAASVAPGSKGSRSSATIHDRASSLPPEGATDPYLPSSRPPRSSTKSDLLPPSMRPPPSGLDLQEQLEEVGGEFGELIFEEEAPTRPLSVGVVPSVPDLGPLAAALPDLQVDRSTPAEYATAKNRGPSESEHQELEKELGIDLSLREPVARAIAPSIPVEVESALKPAQPDSLFPDTSRDLEDELGSASIRPEEPWPIVGRASVRPSSLTGLADRVTSSKSEPYSLAPSALLPRAEAIAVVRHSALEPHRLLEPSSQPHSAPPPSSMTDPAERPSVLPSVGPVVSKKLESVLPTPPDDDEMDEVFAAISLPPQQGGLSSVGEDGEIFVDGVDLMDVVGFQDLPEEAALQLARSARLVAPKVGEELTSFAVALVTQGTVQISAGSLDAACSVVRPGEVIFTRGTVQQVCELRAVAREPGTQIAVFSEVALADATGESPWVLEAWSEVADKYLALAGAVQGPLNGLDEMFRFMVFDKCSLKTRPVGALVATRGQPLDGLYILGGGTLEVVSDDGSVIRELNVGDFVYPETILSAAAAEQNVRVGKKGALLLYAGRMSAHELLATCPPFIEILAS